MQDLIHLSQLLEHSAQRTPEAIAVEDGQGPNLTYGRLQDTVTRLAALFQSWGLRPGDRVGLALRKGPESVCTILAALRAGSAYVPVDPLAPTTRNGLILGDCEPRVLVCDARWAVPLVQAIGPRGAATRVVLVGDPVVAGAELDDRGQAWTGWRTIETMDPAGFRPPPVSDLDLAYILYTSGSTGRPKGVMLAHRNALCFVDWCSEVFQPRGADRCSSHAPFHFDLSIFDLFVTVKHGATLVLVGEELGKEPTGLARYIAQRRLTIWYSAPSILALMAQSGALAAHDYDALRLVLFAGEVFPIKHLKRLRDQWPAPTYYNLYGPTETNVCTAYRLDGPLAPDRSEPLPIGRPCPYARDRLLAETLVPPEPGRTGELCIAGDSVMQGYWRRPDLAGRVWIEDTAGVRWYRTGDLVSVDDAGNYHYLGRTDRMIKRRGYRVELGEIEVTLYRHSQVREAAVVAAPHGDGWTRIHAIIVPPHGLRPSIIELKRHCAEHLPSYMVPDLFQFREALPRTATDKVDYQSLARLIGNGG